MRGGREGGRDGGGCGGYFLLSLKGAALAALDGGHETNVSRHIDVVLSNIV